MRIRPTRARLLVVGLLAAGVLAGAQPQAQAECLWVRAYVKTTNGNPTWLHGEHDGCVTETPFVQGMTTTISHKQTGLPEWVPNEVWIQTKPTYP